MRVILKEKVKSLGNVGDLLKVSPGYARNFLIPKNLAVLADENNEKQLENERKALAKKMAGEKGAAEELKKKLDGFTVTTEKRVAGNGKLFGAVSAQEIAKLLEKQGIEIEKRLIAVDQPIKQLGSFEIDANLFEGVSAKFNVKVEMDPKQIEEIKKKEAASKKKKAEKKAAEEAGEGAEQTEGAVEGESQETDSAE